MTDTLTESRPRLYRWIARIALGLAILAVVIAAGIVAFVLSMDDSNPGSGIAILGLLFPLAILVFALRLWVYGRSVQAVDAIRAKEMKSGRKVAFIDIALLLGLIGTVCYLATRSPFGNGLSSFSIGDMMKDSQGMMQIGVTFVAPLLIALVFGGLPLLRRWQGKSHAEQHSFGPMTYGLFLLPFLIYAVYAAFAPPPIYPAN